jgi:selenocysteine-specific elongation factor
MGALQVHTTDCRMAFFGRVLCSLPKKSPMVSRECLKVYKLKQKVGVVDHVRDDRTIVGRDLFKKESDLSLFIGLKCRRGYPENGGPVGSIGGLFGKTGT